MMMVVGAAVILAFAIIGYIVAALMIDSRKY